MFGMKKGSAARHDQDYDTVPTGDGVAPQGPDDMAFDGKGFARRQGLRQMDNGGDWMPGTREGDTGFQVDLDDLV